MDLDYFCWEWHQSHLSHRIFLLKFWYLNSSLSYPVSSHNTYFWEATWVFLSSTPPQESLPWQATIKGRNSTATQSTQTTDPLSACREAFFPSALLVQTALGNQFNAQSTCLSNPARRNGSTTTPCRLWSSLISCFSKDSALEISRRMQPGSWDAWGVPSAQGHLFHNPQSWGFC